MSELVLIHDRDTKNYGVYMVEGDDKSRLYLKKGMAKKLVFKKVSEE